MKNKYIGLIFLIVLISFDYSFGQNFTKNSIKLGLGVGIHMGNKTSGTGLVYTVGYQKEIWKDRLRFNPNFSIGQYSSRILPIGARDQHFNTLSLEAKLFFDLIKIEPFSLVVGCGGLINNTRGLIGTGGKPDYYTEKQESEYVNDYHFGGYIGGGFRINPNNKRIAINLLPTNFYFGINLLEYHPKVEIDIKL